MDTTVARRRLEEERKHLLRLQEGKGDRAGLDQEQADSTGNLADYDQHPGDAGTETFERTKEDAIQNQFEAQLWDIEAALERLDAGTYGRCEECGREIADERLEARPATRYCLEHQEEADREAEAMRVEEERF